MKYIRRNISIAGMIIVSLIILGFSLPTYSNTPDDNDTCTTQEVDDRQGGDPGQLADISISAPVSNGSIEYVEVQYHAYGYCDLTYDDTMLCLYDSDGSLQFSKNLGRYHSSEDEVFFNEHTATPDLEHRPKYIVVDHPELRNDSRIQLERLAWRTDYGNNKGWVPYKSEAFEYPKSNKPGNCG